MRLVAFALLIATPGRRRIPDRHLERHQRPLRPSARHRFSNVYAAGTYVLDGQPAAPFVPAQHIARERAIFGTATQFYGWHYPPSSSASRRPWRRCLLAALLVWQGVTLVLICSPSAQSFSRSMTIGFEAADKTLGLDWFGLLDWLKVSRLCLIRATSCVLEPACHRSWWSYSPWQWPTRFDGLRVFVLAFIFAALMTIADRRRYGRRKASLAAVTG